MDIDVGASICEAVEELEARMVVMLSRRSQNLMQNMLFGSAVTYCVRSSTLAFSKTPFCSLTPLKCGMQASLRIIFHWDALVIHSMSIERHLTSKLLLCTSGLHLTSDSAL